LEEEEDQEEEEEEEEEQEQEEEEEQKEEEKEEEEEEEEEQEEEADQAAELAAKCRLGYPCVADHLHVVRIADEHLSTVRTRSQDSTDPDDGQGLPRVHLHGVLEGGVGREGTAIQAVRATGPLGI
jgi:hypothetical protein